MFQEEFIELLKHMASTTVKDISGSEFRPPCQGGRTTGRGRTGPWVAGSDETGAPPRQTTLFRRSAADGHQTLVRDKLRNSGLSQAWGGLERRNALMDKILAVHLPTSKSGLSVFSFTHSSYRDWRQTL
jgi:hypothetical protein